ncbi:MAG: hypothetical protein FJX99_09635 [Bacteroidetes bacterium]|nr:hypothetical protein [Bacteroidota bacterium]
MKNFVKENWYKLMIGSSLFVFSVGFFINSVSPVYSSNTDKETTFKELPNNQKVIQVPVNEDGSVNVKLSEEQMKEIRKPQGNSKYSDFVVKDGKVYGLRVGRSGYSFSDWDYCF